ncbi:MAG TPA: hypothetical protein VL096_13590 [Pirellulaceae bacterium]|nr:hypothetical protein [Pirellulaceae bacterium]
MSDEIEDFIRRAAERRKKQNKAGNKPAARPAAPPKKQRTPLPSVVEAEIVEPPLRENISSYVASHLGSQALTEHASHLGEETALADDRLEARLHQKFDHKLGRLTRSTLDDSAQHSTASAPPSQSIPNTPEAIAEMFRSPLQIRNAFILSEIFARPEHLW